MTELFMQRVSGGFVAVGEQFGALSAQQLLTDAKVTDVEIISGQTPEKSGAQGGGFDDTAAIRTWAALPGRKAARQGSQYRMGTWAGTTTFAAGSRSSLKGSTILQAFGLANSNQLAVIDAGAEVSGLSWVVDGTNYFRRGVRLNDGAVLRDAIISSPTPAPLAGGYDQRSHVLGIFGPNVTIENVILDGFPQQNIKGSPDVPPAAGLVMRNVEFRNYAAGFGAGNLPDALVDGLYAHGLHPEATTNPGQNLLTGGSANSTYQNLHQIGGGSGSGEHFIYSAVPDGTEGCKFIKASNRGSGQCFLKLRGHARFLVSDYHGAGVGMGNAPGTNEDGLRLEWCRNGKISNFSISRHDIRSHYDGIHLNNSWGLQLNALILDESERASVFICTGTSAEYAAPPSGGVNDIRIHDIIAGQMNNRPFLMFGRDDSATNNTCTVGNLTITAIQWAGTKAQLHAIDTGTTLARLAGTRILMTGEASDGPFRFSWAAADPAPTIT